MNKARFSRSGFMTVVAAFLIATSLSATSLTAANEAPAANRYVQVTDDGLVKYLLDTATVKRHTGLSGQSLIDVWVEGRLAAGSRLQTFLGGYPPGIDYSQVGTVRVRYLFRLDSSILQPEAKAAVIERQYFDQTGSLIRRDRFAPPAAVSEWRDLNATEEKVLQALMEKPALRATQGLDKELLSSAAGKELDEGFLGRPWGARPADFEGARHIADIATKVSVYSADLDLSPVLGAVKAYTSPRLVFAEDGGLTKVRIAFDPHDYVRVHLHLVGVLGDPTPIIYEVPAAKIDVIDSSEWLVGINTRVVLTSRLSGATLEISRRDSLSLEGRKFDERTAEAQMKQAQEYERQNRIVEASSIYQELLNGTDSAHLYSETAVEHLAKYSGLSEAVEFLAKYRGYAFSRLRNVLSGTDQLWLRIELDRDVRAQLQQQRPTTIYPDDRLADISAVLCRVRVEPATGKYVVIEQVWLDSANKIVGGQHAWPPQDAVWPAPYIKKACEDFLEAWFTVGGVLKKADK